MTVYDQDGCLVLGRGHATSAAWVGTSKPLDLTQTYYLTCHHLTSPSMVQLLIGFYDRDQLLHSDYLIIKLAPIVLLPNSQPAEMIYVAQVPGVHKNQAFVDEVQAIVSHEGFQLTVVKHDQISMYHRWMQDILKFASCTDGHHRVEGPTLPIIMTPMGMSLTSTTTSKITRCMISITKVITTWTPSVTCRCCPRFSQITPMVGSFMVPQWKHLIQLIGVATNSAANSSQHRLVECRSRG